MKIITLSEIEKAEEVLLEKNNKKFLVRNIPTGQYSGGRRISIFTLKENFEPVFLKNVGYTKLERNHDSLETCCLVLEEITFPQAVSIAIEYLNKII